MLDVDAGASRLALERAHRARRPTPPEFAPLFSADTLDTRQELLDSILAGLSREARPSYDTRSAAADPAASFGLAGAPLLRVPTDALPAASLLLLECGEAGAALGVAGSAPPSPELRVVSALARSALAAAALAAAPRDEAEAEAQLRGALAALDGGAEGAGVESLRASLSATAARLQPSRIAAAFEAGDGVKGRAAAVARLSAALVSSTADDAPPLAALLASLLPRLTSAEVATLVPDWGAPPSGAAPHASSGVRALLARAMSTRSAPLARAALAATASAAPSSFAEERAAAFLLCGDAEGALSAIRASPSPPPQMDASQSGDDGPLPALVGWAEGWVKEKCCDAFADTAATNPSLAAFFADRRVVSALRPSALSVAAAALGGLLQRAGRLLEAASSPAAARRRAATQLPPPPPPPALALPPARAREGEALASGAPGARASTPAPAPRAARPPPPQRSPAAERAAAAVSADKAPRKVGAVLVPSSAKWDPEDGFVTDEPPQRSRPGSQPRLVGGAVDGALPSSPFSGSSYTPPSASASELGYAELLRRKKARDAAAAANGGGNGAGTGVGAREQSSPPQLLPSPAPSAAELGYAELLRRKKERIDAAAGGGGGAPAQARALPAPSLPARSASSSPPSATDISFEELLRRKKARMEEKARADAAGGAPSPAPAPRSGGLDLAPLPSSPVAARLVAPAAALLAVLLAGFAIFARTRSAGGAAPAVTPAPAAPLVASVASSSSSAKRGKPKAVAPVRHADVSTPAAEVRVKPKAVSQVRHADVSTPASAERLVREWQAAKSSGMGPEHASGALPSVLSGPLLEEWTKRCALAKANSFAWSFTLRPGTPKVLRVTGGTPPGEPAAAEVFLEEKGELLDQKTGLVTSGYDSPYRIRYLLEANDGEGYKITKAELIEGEEA